MTTSKPIRYWINLFSPKTWAEFRRAGAKITGFNPRQFKQAGRIQVGDVLLCYLTGSSRFVGTLRVTSPRFEDEVRIFEDKLYPVRFRVEPLTLLDPDGGVPIHPLLNQLTIHEANKPTRWTGRVRSSLGEWNPQDAALIIDACRKAGAQPVIRPLPDGKSKPRPPRPSIALSADEDDEPPTPGSIDTIHTEVQWLLLKLGSDMGLDVWVARNDRGRSFKGQPFATIPRLRPDLPLRFDQRTTSTIEYIDVLWLRGGSITAAFEIESTTSVYSGLLRMSDLLAMQPNLNVPLYVVAPDERRNKVLEEVNRPTFQALQTPLHKGCRFIPFDKLRDGVAKTSAYVHRLDPLFVEDLSEPCDLGEA